jgi:hypothetical protein
VIDFAAMTKNQISTVAGAVLMLGVLLSGCGSADGDQENAGESTSASTFEDYQIAFSACMRENGFDVPDPSGDGSLKVPAIDDMDAFTKASEACQDKLGPPPAPEGEPTKSDEERLAEMVAIAECFREHGVDVPDPKQGEMISIPLDAPEDVLKACAPEGISGPASPGGK